MDHEPESDELRDESPVEEDEDASSFATDCDEVEAQCNDFQDFLETIRTKPDTVRIMAHCAGLMPSTVDWILTIIKIETQQPSEDIPF